MNDYPTRNEEAALRDVLRHVGESLAERAGRLRVTRGGVNHLLVRCEAKGLAERDGAGKWAVTIDGRKWLRPTMATRGSR